MKTFVIVMLFLLISSISIIPCVYATDKIVYIYNPSDFTFSAWILKGAFSINNSNKIYNVFPEVNEPERTLTIEFPIMFNSGINIIEIEVPDSYLRCSISKFQNNVWVNHDGNNTVSLSVPYLYNCNNTPVPDWGILPFSTPSGEYGTLKRIQICFNETTIHTDLIKIIIKYAINPSFGFDGIDDYFSRTLPLNAVFTSASVIHAQVTFQENVNMINYNYEGRHIWLDGVFNFDYRMEIFNGSYYGFVLDNHNSLSQQKIDVIWNSTHAIQYTNNSYSKNYALSGCFTNEPTFVLIGTYNRVIEFTNTIYNNISLFVSTEYENPVFIINSSSLSGNSNNTVIDFSNSNNHLTAFGNCQYKTWNKNYFQTTYISEYLENDLTPLFILIMVFILCLIFYLLKIPLFVLLSSVIGLLLNLTSLSMAIAFTPYIQLMLSILELSMLYKSAMNIMR